MPTPIVVRDASGQEEVVRVGTTATTEEEEEGSQLLNLEAGDVAVGHELQQDGVEAISVAVHLEVGQEAVGPELQQDGVEATSVAAPVHLEVGQDAVGPELHQDGLEATSVDVDPPKGNQVYSESEGSVARHGVLEANVVSKKVDSVSASPRFPVVQEQLQATLLLASFEAQMKATSNIDLQEADAEPCNVTSPPQTLHMEAELPLAATDEPMENEESTPQVADVGPVTPPVQEHVADDEEVEESFVISAKEKKTAVLVVDVVASELETMQMEVEMSEVAEDEEVEESSIDELLDTLQETTTTEVDGVPGSKLPPREYQKTGIRKTGFGT